MSKIKSSYLVLLVICLLLMPMSIEAQNLIAEGQRLEKITSGYQLAEGPYWHPDGYLLFSDFPANVIYKWMPGSKEAEVFIKPSGHTNGITDGPDGNLILAQHDGMISMLKDNKKFKVLAKSYNGKRLNSPNDLTIASNGTIYFTDPPFGISKENKELSVNGVYMLRRGGSPQLIYGGFERPNGIVLSSDETKVYVNNWISGQIIVFEREENGELTNPRKFANVGVSTKSGAADGMVVDKKGRLYCTGPGGIYVFSAEGNQLKHIKMPALITNMAWGGDSLKTLYLTAPNAIYRLEMAVTGIKK